MRRFVFAAIVLVLACDSAPSASGGGAVVEISQQDLMSRATEASFILDVRSPEEYAAGHVPRAINIPHDQIEARLAELEAHKTGPVVLYCKSGRRAGLAAEVLARAGFSKLQHLTGDMDAWTASGLPIETNGS